MAEPDLVVVADTIPDIVIDLHYSSSSNITGRPISAEYTARLARPTVEALTRAAGELRLQGYRLVVWDAYRAAETQEILRQAQPDGRYVLERSNHTKGLAVDISLANLEGELLDMGTDHDEFTERAYAAAKELTPNQHKNRAVLTLAMGKAGFKQWPYEWWHFDYPQPD